LKRERDEEKKKACEEVGIELICIPYWWNETIQELVRIICEQNERIGNRIISLLGDTSQWKEDHSQVNVVEEGSNKTHWRCLYNEEVDRIDPWSTSFDFTHR
jgi:hypothetical protein